MPKSSRALYSNAKISSPLISKSSVGRSKIDGGKTVGFDSHLVGDGRVAKTLRVFDQNSIDCDLKQDQVCLELAAIDFQRHFLAILHYDLGFDDFFSARGVDSQGRAFESFDVASGKETEPRPV